MTSKLKTDVLETVSGSGTIALTNQLSGMTDASMPAGSVVQVVQNYAATSPQIATTSTSLVASGIIATITPKYSNSKILISWSNTMQLANGSSVAEMRSSVGGGTYASMAAGGVYQIGYGQSDKNQYSPWVFNGNVVVSSTATLSIQPFIKTFNSEMTFIHVNSSYALTLTEIKQ